MEPQTHVDHPSAWERVKAALRRDWEQTRNDLSGGKSGEDLNQDLDDTVAQAFGKEPVPGAHTPNPLDADELHDKVVHAQRQMRRAERKFERESHRSARAWADAERAVRFGYLASLERRGAWDAAVEARLRRDFEAAWPEVRWEDEVDAVRFGWRGAQPRF